jgi:nucleotide-binding universal stress UspA family protein
MPNIIAAADGSDASESVIAIAANVAFSRRSELTVVHCLPVGSGRQKERASVEVRERLAELASRAGADEVRIEIVEGVSAVEIARIAAETSSSLVVVGPHRTRGRLDGLLGSTAERIARETASPCLIAKRPFPAPPRRVIVSTDFSDSANAALRAAIAFAGASRCRREAGGAIQPLVELVYVVRPEDAGDTLTTTRGFERAMASCDGIDTEFTVRIRPRRVVAPDPIEGIRQAAEEFRADVIALGTRMRRPMLASILGATAVRAIATLPWSALLVPATYTAPVAAARTPCEDAAS